MIFANRIGSWTSCSIWLPETSPPSSYRGGLRHRFKVATLPAALLQNRAVGDFQDQRVLEGVLDVRQDRLFVDEPTKLQITQHLIQIVIRFADHIPDQPQREPLADHRQGLDKLLLVGWQPVDTRGEDRLYSGRDAPSFSLRDGPFCAGMIVTIMLIWENPYGLFATFYFRFLRPDGFILREPNR